MAARIVLRVAQYRKFASLKGLRTDDAAAAVIGVNPATLSRVLKGTTYPGERFIAGALAAFPELDFGDLFEVIDTDEAA